MKFVFVCAVLALLYCTEAQRHNQEWGRHEIGERRLYIQLFMKDSSFLKVQKDTMRYIGIPQITCIQVTDKYTDGKGGFATILKGGPGHDEVEIEFMSQRGLSYNFLVEIWGK